LGRGKPIRINPKTKKEGNMKRAFALACAASLAILAFCSPASADQSLSGTYEMVATGICNHSTKGWYDANNVKNGPTPPWTPIKGSHVWAANATMQGTVTFNSDGSGLIFPYTNYISLLPGGEPVPEIGRYPVSEAALKAGFTYTIAGNMITITTGGGTIMHGGLSSDRKTMVLVNASQLMDYTKTEYKSWAIQNMIRVLVRTDN
jgi:hypothetical protein